jgi:hypothetical protein
MVEGRMPSSDNDERTIVAATGNPIGKTTILGRNTEVSEETVPGWTIMRPLKRKGKRGSDGGSVAKLVPSANSDGSRVDGKPGNDLKVTETNGSADGYPSLEEIDSPLDVRSDDELLDPTDGAQSSRIRRKSPTRNLEGDGDPAGGSTEYKVYRRRWFGLVQLVLLNIVVSWDVSSLLRYACVYTC